MHSLIDRDIMYKCICALDMEKYVFSRHTFYKYSNLQIDLHLQTDYCSFDFVPMSHV